jgi:hypothetical protein
MHGTSKTACFRRFLDGFGAFLPFLASFGPFYGVEKICFKIGDCQSRETNFERMAPQSQLTTVSLT